MDTFEKRFPIIEIFGPTIQGEGPDVGVQSHFVRFGGCDFRCVWCDTPDAVLPERVRVNARRLTASEIVNKVAFLDAGERTPLVVLSGGNPLLHELREVVLWLKDYGFRVSVETQGTLWKEWVNLLDQVVVSPKPPSSKMPGSTRMLKPFLSRTKAPVAIKVPCYDARDVEWAANLATEFPAHPFFISVVTEAGNTVGGFADGRVDSPETLLARTRNVLEWVQSFPGLKAARVFPQQHFLLWSNEKGH